MVTIDQRKTNDIKNANKKSPNGIIQGAERFERDNRKIKRQVERNVDFLATS